MKRILTFHYPGTAGGSARMYPSAYYMDEEYTPFAVRIYAQTAPKRDATFDIYDDGTSIFNEKGSTSVHATTGVISTLGSGTSIDLAANQNSEDSAEDFNGNTIEKGSWVYCVMQDAGGGENFTVQFELHQVSEDEEEED